MSIDGNIPPKEPQKEIPRDAVDELKTSYMTYAMSVITDRALPDIRDGLKPVHRRILYSMDDMGLQSNKSHKKCALVVGDVLGKFHPHGDASIYDALVRMAQNFSLRYPVIDGQGNFGSVDGDPAAHMRYTECRLSKISQLMLKDIEKDTIDFVPNYADFTKEPHVLPSAIPFYLINGGSGIAVGMATNIPPHNIREIVNAIEAQIDNREITIDELMTYIMGPDFPTGGIIFGREGIRDAYKTGRGKITIRSRVSIEETKTGKDVIIVEDLPYQVNKANLIEKIAELVSNNKIQGISDIRDESDKDNFIRIVIELKRGIIPKVVLNQLFTHTDLQISYGIINLALDKGVPKILNLKQTIQAYIDFRKEVIERRTKFELKKANDRLHIIEGFLIAIDNIDEIITIIRSSEDTESAKKRISERFNLSEMQANAIVEMRLRQLTNLESKKLKSEYEELLVLIAKLKEILSSDLNILKVVKEELIKDTTPFFDERKTDIISKQLESIDVEDLIHKEDMVVIISHLGYIKRISSKDFRSQSKGGVGVMSSKKMRSDDFNEHIFVASTHDYLLIFSSKGMVYQIKVHEIQQLSKDARGDHIKSMIGIGDEEISAIINVHSFTDDHYAFIATKKGIVKRVPLKEFEYKKISGKRAISLDDNDAIIDVKITDGKKEIILATSMGKSLRFIETKVREMGRVARGVTGIRLAENDSLCGVCIVDNDSFMLLITKNGFGKRLDFDLFMPHGRGTGGQRYYRHTKEKGDVAAVKQVLENDEIMLMTLKGQIMKLPVKQISQQGRNATGIRVVKLSENDEVSSVARIIKEDV